MSIIPGNRPKQTREQTQKILENFRSNGVFTHNLKILGVRGYFKSTMGDPNVNDISMYDDAIFVISDSGLFMSFNGNVDPSKAKQGVATLVAPQMVMYRVGIHGISHLNLVKAGDKAIYDQMLKTGQNPKPIEGRYLPHWAFRQHGRVTITRQGSKIPVTDNAASPFYIDIHRGGNGTTSSLGCQTIYAPQWDEMFETTRKELQKLGQIDIPYCLIDSSKI
jgi:lysozyme